MQSVELVGGHGIGSSSAAGGGAGSSQSRRGPTHFTKPRENRHALTVGLGFLECGVPLGPVQSAEDITNCEHLEKRKAFAYIDDPVAGRKKLMGSAFKLSGLPDLSPTPPPRLGEHNREILQNILGYSEEKLKELEEQGVI